MSKALLCKLMRLSVQGAAAFSQTAAFQASYDPAPPSMMPLLVFKPETHW